MKEPIIIAAVILGLCGVAYGCKPHDDRLWSNYVHVQPGMSAAQAEAIPREAIMAEHVWV